MHPLKLLLAVCTLVIYAFFPFRYYPRFLKFRAEFPISRRPNFYLSRGRFSFPVCPGAIKNYNLFTYRIIVLPLQASSRSSRIFIALPIYIIYTDDARRRSEKNSRKKTNLQLGTGRARASEQQQQRGGGGVGALRRAPLRVRARTHTRTHTHTQTHAPTAIHRTRGTAVTIQRAHSVARAFSYNNNIFDDNNRYRTGCARPTGERAGKSPAAAACSERFSRKRGGRLRRGDVTRAAFASV